MGDRRAIASAVVGAVGVATVGALPSIWFPPDTTWFDEPWLYPPEIAFPVLWTVLFGLMGIALSVVWRAGPSSRLVRLAIGAFAVQFALNIAWTPVFFGWQRPDLALVVITLLWLAIAVTIVTFARVNRRAAVLLVPYLAWVTFAGILNAAITAGA